MEQQNPTVPVQPVTPQPAPSVPVNPQTEMPTPPPSMVPPAYIYAGFGRRLVASLIDGIIVGVIYGIITAIFSVAASITKMSAISSIGSVLEMVIGYGYSVYFIASKGQTLGKMAMKIKVVKVDGSKVGYVGAFLREVVGKIISTLVFGLGYFWMLWDGRKQTFHDKIAGTVVIKA